MQFIFRLSVCLCYILFSCAVRDNDKNSVYLNEIEQLKIKIEHLRSDQLKVMHNNGATLKDVKVLSPNGLRSKLSDQLIHPKTFILVMRENVCLPCVDDYFEFINSKSIEVGIDKIILLFKYESFREMKIKALKAGIKCTYFQLLNDLEIVDTKSRPIMFLLDKNMNMSFTRINGTPDSLWNNYVDRITKLLM